MSSVPPAGATPPPSDSSNPSDTTPTAPLPASATGPQTMNDFLALFTPEERAQFMEILMKNLVTSMSHENKRYLEEMRREREMEGRY